MPAAFLLSVQAYTPLWAENSFHSEQGISNEQHESLRWRKYPKFIYFNEDLRGASRFGIFKLMITPSGEIQAIRVDKSTGVPRLDLKAVRAIKKARFKQLSVSYDAITTLPVEFLVNTDDSYLNKKDLHEWPENTTLVDKSSGTCLYNFSSTNWKKQIINDSTSFDYIGRPQLSVAESELMGQNRHITYSMKKSGSYISSVTITQSSGIPELDNKVIHALMNHQVASHQAWWILTPVTLYDETHFNLSECATPAGTQSS